MTRGLPEPRARFRLPTFDSVLSLDPRRGDAPDVVVLEGEEDEDVRDRGEGGAGEGAAPGGRLLGGLPTDHDLEYLDVGVLDHDQGPVEQVPDELELQQGDGHQGGDGERYDDR